MNIVNGCVFWRCFDRLHTRFSNILLFLTILDVFCKISSYSAMVLEICSTKSNIYLRVKMGIAISFPYSYSKSRKT